MKKCKWCGEEFEQNTPWNKQTCSKECGYEIFKEKQKDQYHTLIPVEIKCSKCGVSFFRKLPKLTDTGECNECIYSRYKEERKGKNNPNYKTGKGMFRKKVSKISNIHKAACLKYRRVFLEKNQYLYCEICKVNSNGTPFHQVHHLYFASQYPRHKNLHDFKNLILVCVACHQQFHTSNYKDHFIRLEKERGLKELFKESHK